MTDDRIDIALAKGDDGIYDEVIGADGDFVSDESFNTAIILSLYPERRADEDTIPIAAKRRGWVGNETNEDNTYELGSLQWLNEQARTNSDTKNASVGYVKEALAWLVPNYLNDIKVSGFLRSEGVELEIVLVRKNKKIDKLYFKLWENTGF